MTFSVCYGSIAHTDIFYYFTRIYSGIKIFALAFFFNGREKYEMSSAQIFFTNRTSVLFVIREEKSSKKSKTRRM